MGKKINDFSNMWRRKSHLAKTGLPLAKKNLLCLKAVKCAVARHSNQSGTIVRVTIKFP